MPEGAIDINLDIEIGSGGAGRVYLADYTDAGVNAAAKVRVGCVVLCCVVLYPP